MSANTSPDNITYPVSTDQVAPLETVFATMATSVQNAFDASRRNFSAVVADLAARNALFPSPVQGNRVWRNDLGLEETYYGLYNATTNPGGRAAAGWALPDLIGGVAPVSGFTLSGETSVRRTAAGMVHAVVGISRPTGIPGAVPIAIMNAGFRPTGTIEFAGTTSQGGSAGVSFIQIQSSGNVLVYSPGASNQRAAFVVSYPGA